MRRSLASLAARLLSRATQQAWASTAAAATGGGAAALQQRTAKVHHAGRPLLRHRRLPSQPSALRRAAAAAAKAAGLAAVGLPLSGVAALVAAGRREGADAAELLASLPRTARMVWWGAWATARYKALAAAHAADPPGSAAYQQALAELHQHAADRLLLAIQQCGGVYIKAGQLMVSLNAVPPEYRG